MAWQDKALEAKYTSPSGKEFYFTWDKSLTRETELKTGIFTFPDRDGAHVQHQGAGATSFPFEVIFHGPDCMDRADEFEAALIEREVAELQHPVYGIIKVIPTGNIKREDDLISALNESHVTITFTETITDESPTELEAVSADSLEEKYDDFLESAATDFAESISIESVAEELQLQSVMEIQAQTLDDNLSGLIATDASALADFKTSVGELKASIKELKTDRFSRTKDLYKNIYNDAKKVFKDAEKIVQKAINTARLALNLMKMPSKISVNLMEKIKGYSQLITSIVNQFKNDPFGTKNVKNAFTSTCLVLNGCIASIATGSALSIAEVASSSSGGFSASRSMSTPSAEGSRNTPGDNGSGGSGGDDSGGGSGGSGGDDSGGDSGSSGGLNNDGYSSGGDSIAARDGGGTISREETIQVMNQLIALFETIKSFQDTKIGNNIIIDSNSNTYLLLNELIYASIQLIQNVSFSLPMQRTILLNRDRQVIELCCELYGSSDYLDKFIAENDFNIDEIELIPMGREVTYYVKVA
jgi:hypothetical protein